MRGSLRRGFGGSSLRSGFATFACWESSLFGHDGIKGRTRNRIKSLRAFRDVMDAIKGWLSKAVGSGEEERTEKGIRRKRR